jgi:plasmid stabilization system protein ParE
MAYSIRYLPKAADDIQDIDAYLSVEAPQKAKRFFAELEKSIRLASQMPEMHPAYAPFPPYRRIVVLDYLVFYLIEPELHSICVHRIIHGAMDLPSRLFC